LVTSLSSGTDAVNAADSLIVGEFVSAVIFSRRQQAPESKSESFEKGYHFDNFDNEYLIKYKKIINILIDGD
jgi:hypothetical protein